MLIEPEEASCKTCIWS